jgi:hypothetical protein
MFRTVTLSSPGLCVFFKNVLTLVRKYQNVLRDPLSPTAEYAHSEVKEKLPSSVSLFASLVTFSLCSSPATTTCMLIFEQQAPFRFNISLGMFS